jgi:hypothetical protein
MLLQYCKLMSLSVSHFRPSLIFAGKSKNQPNEWTLVRSLPLKYWAGMEIARRAYQSTFLKGFIFQKNIMINKIYANAVWPITLT